MASNYGLNFGFRRSDEDYRIAEGRYRAPKTGVLLQGAVVTIDGANPGYLKVASATDKAETGVTGIMIQELAWDVGIYDVAQLDSFTLNKVKNDRQAVLTSGAGTKIWLRNTPASTRADGRVIGAITMVTLTGLVVLDYLGWDGTKWVKVTDTTLALGRVLSIDTAKGLIEAVLLH